MILGKDVVNIALPIGDHDDLLRGQLGGHGTRLVVAVHPAHALFGLQWKLLLADFAKTVLRVGTGDDLGAAKPQGNPGLFGNEQAVVEKETPPRYRGERPRASQGLVG